MITNHVGPTDEALAGEVRGEVGGESLITTDHERQSRVGSERSSPYVTGDKRSPT